MDVETSKIDCQLTIARNEDCIRMIEYKTMPKVGHDRSIHFRNDTIY